MSFRGMLGGPICVENERNVLRGGVKRTNGYAGWVCWWQASKDVGEGGRRGQSVKRVESPGTICRRYRAASDTSNAQNH